MAVSVRRLMAVVVITSATASGCSVPLIHAATGDYQTRGQQGVLITRADIKRCQAVDAWDALKRQGVSLSMHERAGDGASVVQRGPSSIWRSSEMLLVVDETMTVDLAYLRQIPANDIESIRILSGTDGTLWYGTLGGNGVIVVKTVRMVSDSRG